LRIETGSMFFFGNTSKKKIMDLFEIKILQIKNVYQKDYEEKWTFFTTEIIFSNV
jgi:hypothetical protein